MSQLFVSGTAIGYDKQRHLSIKVLTDHAGAEDRDKVRNRLQGIPVVFEETGEITAL